MSTDLAALRLNLRIDEGRGPVIVLLHGINSTADDMRPLVELLRPDYRVIAPDLLGFGDSPKPLDIDYTTDEHVPQARFWDVRPQASSTPTMHATTSPTAISGTPNREKSARE